MQQYEVSKIAIAQKARSERLYLHYALGLGVLMTIAGTVLVILGVGDHLDIVVHGSGDLEARFINASPGVALWITSAAIFWLSKPKQLRANARHVGHGNRHSAASLPATAATHINAESLRLRRELDSLGVEGGDVDVLFSRRRVDREAVDRTLDEPKANEPES